MAIRHIVTRGLGSFSQGVKFLPTHGFGLTDVSARPRPSGDGRLPFVVFPAKEPPPKRPTVVVLQPLVLRLVPGTALAETRRQKPRPLAPAILPPLVPVTPSVPTVVEVAPLTVGQLLAGLRGEAQRRANEMFLLLELIEEGIVPGPSDVAAQARFLCRLTLERSGLSAVELTDAQIVRELYPETQ